MNLTLRPVDENGDILPVLDYEDLVDGADAIAQLVRYRLQLLTGDWWENSGWGCDVLEMIRASRMTEADQEVLASYLSTYIRQTEGVQELDDIAFSVDGRTFRYSCRAMTAEGETQIDYEM